METQEVEKKEQIIEEKANIEENLEQENQSVQEHEKEKIGKKLTGWLCNLILCILVLGFIFVMYKIFKPQIKLLVQGAKSAPLVLSNININCDVQEIAVGESIKINTIIEPQGFVLENLIWESSNPEILSIVDGTATAITTGTAQVTLKSGETTSNILQINCIQNVEEIKLNKTGLKITIGKTETIKAEILPIDATNQNITWTCDNENIAKVDNGTVTAIEVGTATVTATDFSGKVQTSCTVVVEPVEVKSVSLDETNVKLGVGQSYLLLSYISPSNATYQDLTWASSNKSVVNVSNGKVKAIGVGQANVTITAKNGKTATCAFNVTNSAPSNTVKYAKNTYNIRSGPSTNYTILTSVKQNNEVEILKSESTGWTKVRANGIVGYIISSAYSSTKYYYISNVPYLNQFSLGYPTGCEAVSATMVAQYKGYKVSPQTVVANTPTDEKGIRTETIEKKTEVETINPKTDLKETTIEVTTENILYGGNPFEVFVGHPTKGLSTGSYGCFAKPITVALQKSGVSCTNISDCSSSTLFSYIEKGNPVIVWCVKNAGDLIVQETWTYPDNSGTYTKLKGEHCAVLIGYDGDYVYLNDPSAGKDVKQSKTKFLSNWNQLYCQAIVVN